MSTRDSKPIPSLSLDAKLAYERLISASVGEVITYEELTRIIGRNSQGVGRGIIDTARRKALRENNVLFGAVMSVGLKRLSDVEIVATGEETVRKIRRASSRGYRKITAVGDFNMLPPQEKSRHNLYASVLGALSQATSAPKMKRLESRVSEAKSTLPLSKTLEAFSE